MEIKANTLFLLLLLFSFTGTKAKSTPFHYFIFPAALTLLCVNNFQLTTSRFIIDLCDRAFMNERVSE
jgi:hypothetical protein